LKEELDMGPMHQQRLWLGLATYVVLLILVPPAPAEVIEYDEKSEWIDAVGEFSTIGFSDLPNGTWVFEQYAHLGAHFVDGADIIRCCDPNLFPEDGAGLDGNTEVHVVFDEPLTYLAVDYPGYVRFALFDDGELIYENNWFGHGQIGQFAGVVSSGPFNEMRLTDPIAYEVFIDDLHFGPPIPAPGALALFALTLIGSTRRRRT
jgi:MYXO-CTERM domain-containing protein